MTREEQLERRLKKVYAQAAKELGEKANAYFDRFERLDAQKKELVEKGELLEREYANWRRNRIMEGQRWLDIQQQMAESMTNANKIAASYINRELPPLYAQNFNEVGEQAEKLIAGYSFDLTDEVTIRNLATTNDTLLPYKFVDGKKDVRWNTRLINSSVLQGILQGESMPKIARRLAQTVPGMNYASAKRNARTAFTGAQNKGRLDGMKQLQDDGVIIKKEWLTAIDDRTRDAHAELNGVQEDIDKPFKNSIGQIMFPGDPNAAPANVYNCRCTLAQVIVGFEKREKEDIQEQTEDDDKYFEELKRERAEIIEMDDMEKGAWLYEHEVGNMDDLLKAAENGTVDEYVNRYFDAMEENGSTISKKELIGQPNIDELVAFNNGDFQAARMQKMSELTGLKGKELDEVNGAVKQWVSNDWDHANSTLVDKYIDSDGTYNGDLWRGLHFGSEESLKEFTDKAFIGGTFNAGKVGKNASWSSDRLNAESFASVENHRVLIHCVGNKSASPIDYMNQMGEMEVVSHSMAKYTVIGVQQEIGDGISKTIITVVEKSRRD